MKILLIYPYFGTPAGSWSTRIYEFSRRWVEQGHQVEVVTAPYEKSDIQADGFISQQEVNGIRLTVINSEDNNRLPVWRRGISALLFSTIACYYALSRNYDVILVSSGPITVGLPMIVAKIIRQKKTVFEVRDLWPEGAIQLGKIKNPWLIKLSRLFEHQCYEKADLVVTASPGMEEGVLKISPSARTLTIPNASDIELFNIPPTYPSSYIPSLKEKKIILYAGSLGLMDECETAIRAMSFFHSEPLALVIIGEGSEKSYLQQIATKTGNPNIYFLGLIPKSEVAKWYSLATASLVGFKNFKILGTCSPNKLFDSFAAGIPVIQNTSGWIKELIEDADVGFNARCEVVNDYVMIYNKILEDDIELKRRNSLNLAQNQFSRNILAQKYLEEIIRIS